MKTIRTIIATLAVELLAYAVFAWFSVRRSAAFLQRTVYQGFDQTFVVALVMGCAFLLIAVILTVAIASTDDDDGENGYEEEEAPRPRSKGRARIEDEAWAEEPKRAHAPKGEQPYRRVTRDRAMSENRPAKGSADGFARPKARPEERPAAERAPQRRERAAERPDEIAFRRGEDPVKKVRKIPKPLPPEEDEFLEVAEPVAAPQPRYAAPKAPAAEERADMTPEEEPEATVRPEALPEPAVRPEEEAGAEEEALRTEPEVLQPEPETVMTEPEAPAEERPEVPEETPAAPEEQPTVEKEEPMPAPGPEMAKGEGTVRCVFCGRSMRREALFCPNCGKKR